MSDQVNLLQQTKAPKTERSKLLVFSFLFILVTVVITVGMFIFLFYLKNEEAQILSRQDTESQTIAQFAEKKALFQSTKERLLTINQLENAKDTIYDKFFVVADIIPGEVDLTGVNVNAAKVDVSVSSRNLSEINTFLETNLKNLADNNNVGIKRIQVNSLGIQSLNGSYSVSVSVEF